MQDALTSILNKYDITGKYLDATGIQKIEVYFNTAIDMLKISEIISSNSSKIVKEAANILYIEQPELLRPGGNSYTTRRYATCLRDIDYYLRYITYSLIAGNTDILNERLLDGLKETYLSLNVPVGPIVRSVEILKEIVYDEIKNNKISITNQEIVAKPFDYVSSSLSEQNI
uniref:Allophycocyanin beta 18 subunit n=1 Tax=Pleurostichidium falkenbergii TaxID=121064 RepID=A0A4D6UYK5_9FLOR|nr:allophycocyanin beta 18 subunit [Pleurostichidium falkenbergii]QCH39624.1 allophycocyanin beta 18 subunit [Pleurostichidium falkenbergii]